MKQDEANYIAKSFGKVLILLFVIILSVFPMMIIDDLDDSHDIPYTETASTEQKTKFNVNNNEKFEIIKTSKFVIETYDYHVYIPKTKTTKKEYSYVVYITDYGTKYHRADCGSLWDSCYAIDYGEAISSGYFPCSRCNP